ncbi:uncharacterized protein LOC116205867 isoform X1 [Punica granatum]|uniref:Uncharacterized protein LOC116205867 isoform X1 n=3 Tax=Punica granatum TaxID=22663 RepID=A0A6P8DJ07_PUNGR|nr:uncharacterized protein LOC116205867 isoform X1 [Punica granatum]
MQCKLSLSVARLKWAPSAHPRGCFKTGHSAKNLSQHSSRFKLVGQAPGDRWKLSDIDANAVQEQVNLWLSKTQNFLSEVTIRLVKSGHGRKPDAEDASTTRDELEIFMAEQTVNRRTPNGILSLEAVLAIEQFGRMNGLTGQKMQRIFNALVPETVHVDARNLVEYCCFRYLSRDSSHIHPSLKEPAFQKLIFITMLAWENPYCEEDKSYAYSAEKALFQDKIVGEEAFVRIAPAISGVADYCTVHNLFKALAGDGSGVSLRSWLTYINELLKVHEGRKTYQTPETFQISEEKIVCIGSSRKHPVLKWDNNIAWPGKVILTNKAIYFEAVGRKSASRLDLTRKGLRAEKAKVGPLGSDLFDSAVSISCGPQSETWVLEFVDLGGEMRRDVWHAFISEVISLHKFIDEYAPEAGDKSVLNVFGAQRGMERATISAVNSVARLQVLQFMKKLLDDPTKLVQFSYLMSAPHGDIVCQALAVNFWGGPLVTKFSEAGTDQQAPSASIELSERMSPVFDIDGSIYLKKWMRSPSWYSSASIGFWKNSNLTKQGLVLSKNLVVGDASLVEKAALMYRRKSQVVEKTQATIDAAMLKGIPNNIDLFKEIMLPLTIVVKNFEKLRRWEEPYLTVSFLAFSYTIIIRDLLSYVFPAILIALAAAMLTLKGLKEQGRLGRSFGKVTIRDQPPSNTIQKILAVKDAMRDVESYLQNLNVILLKIRTIVLSGQPQITTEVALVLLSSATIKLIVPFKYIFGFLLFDLFTRELEFRREMVQRFMSILKERWKMVPAAPVVVLPYESDESKSRIEGTQKDENDEINTEKNQNNRKPR